MLEVTPLRYFVSAFELGTISAAASGHGISQPSLSQALQKLEDAIGTSLFVRSRTGLRPTPAGRDLYHHAQSILRAVGEAENRFLKEPPLRLSLYTAPDILLPAFQGAFHALRTTYPTLEMRFEQAAADAELSLVDKACSPKSHKYRELYSEPYVLVVARSHPLAGRNRISMDDLQSVSLISRRYCPNYDALLAEFALAGLPLNVSAEAVNDQQVLELAGLGFGAAILPAGHLKMKDTLTGVPLDHEGLERRSVGIAVKKTAFADEMFRTWMTGWATLPIRL
ncbi:LysR family transcriptional regulator [Roseibium sp. RP-7]